MTFTRMGWPVTDVDPAIGGDPGDDPIHPNGPPFPPTFNAQNCGVTCTAFTLEEAQLCANAGAFLCANTHPPDDNPEPVFFYNTPQACTVACSDGSQFVWHVAAGVFPALTQAAADAQAAQYACIQAHINRICLDDIRHNVCENSAYSSTIHANTSLAAVSFSVIAGALPTGIVLNQTGPKTAVLLGVPTDPGDYVFTIAASNPNGAVQTKNYLISVVGIVQDTLPEGVIGDPYSETLTPAGGDLSSFVFARVSGSLPDGLSLAGDGTISGTPTTEETATFIVSLTNADGVTCQKELSIEIDPAASCPDWDELLWGVPNIVTNGDGVASFNPNSVTGDIFDSSVKAATSGTTACSAQNTGTLSCSGAGRNCNLHVLYNCQDCAGQIIISINALPPTVFIFPANGTNSPGGTDVPFVVPAGAVNITVQAALQVSPGGGPQTGQQSSYQAKITNI